MYIGVFGVEIDLVVVKEGRLCGVFDDFVYICVFEYERSIFVV